MSDRFEISVPLVVTLDKDGAITGWRLDTNGWGGFFSTASEAMGTWNLALEEWDREVSAGYANAAWQFVREHLPEIDTTSSASRQHYIDTGEYLREGEALESGSPVPNP